MLFVDYPIHKLNDNFKHMGSINHPLTGCEISQICPINVWSCYVVIIYRWEGGL